MLSNLVCLKKTFLTLTFLLPLLLTAQENSPWKTVNKNKIPSENILKSHTRVSQQEIYKLDFSLLENQINQAPKRHTNEDSNIRIDFPVSANKTKKFRLYKTQTLSTVLTEKFFSIQSYVGISKDKKHHLRLTIANGKVYGMVSGGKATLFINPYAENQIYQVFEKRDATRTEGMECLVESVTNQQEPSHKSSEALLNVDEGILRNYRIAVSTTGEYAQFHIEEEGLENESTAQQVAGVLAAITVTIDRVNEVYERDLGITLTLVDDNEDIIFLDANTDPFSNNNSNALLGENQETVDDEIGEDNYDIGHVFSTGGGGVALFSSVCVPGFKAQGVTGSPAPIGDPYDIDYVAHEIGHQFGANHTFNGDTGSCGGFNRNDDTAVEPGSGSTIMAYAGLCFGEDVQQQSDSYFHSISIEQIYENISESWGGSCAEEISINNTAPEIASLQDYTIPYGTPFRLATDEATDAENDELTYCWEQTDTEIIDSPPSANEEEGPVFRSLEPTEEPYRYLPPFETVLDNETATDWEVLPEVARTLNFILTVRDNNLVGGQSATEAVTINVADAGPFQITSQNENDLEYADGDTVEITWDVAGTTENDIDTENITILLSYDGGENFSEVLAEETPNDGSEEITLPEGTFSDECRIKIEAIDNIFYAVNTTEFSIVDEVMSVATKEIAKIEVYPNPNKGSFTVTLNKNTTENIQAEVYDMQGRLVKTTELNSAAQRINLDNPQTGMYLLKVNKGKKQVVKKLIVE